MLTIKSYVHHSNIWNFADESVVSLKQMAASSLDALVYTGKYIHTPLLMAIISPFNAHACTTGTVSCITSNRTVSE